jgi:hypothetical protein
MSRDAERQRAKALKVADARDLFKASLPFVLQNMTAAQIDQVQRVLDAYVVNPAVQKEVDELYRKSVIAQSGGLVNRDPEMVRRAQRTENGMIRIKEADKHVRLDFAKLLAPNALKPTTDNPDEAAYLIDVAGSLAQQGVWLRFDFTLVKDPEDPSRRIPDFRKFQAWLSLGFSGDTIPSEAGRLTRKALLGTTALGAGYYEAVDEGPTQTALKKMIDQLLVKIEGGRQQHQIISKMRRNAFPGVVKVSEWRGRADYPDEKMWEEPRQIVLQAMSLNASGTVKQAGKLVFLAALMTHLAAQRLNDYIDAFSLGAERAVKVLKVLKTAGEVAQVVLVTTGVGAGMVRLLSRRAATAGFEAAATGAGRGASGGAGNVPAGGLPVPAGTAGAGESAAAGAGDSAGAGASRVSTGGAPRPAQPVTNTPLAHQTTNLANVRQVYANTLQRAGQAGVTMDSSAAGARITGAGTSRYDLAFEEETRQYIEYVTSRLRANPNATLAEKRKFIDEADAKWGSWLPGD